MQLDLNLLLFKTLLAYTIYMYVWVYGMSICNSVKETFLPSVKKIKILRFTFNGKQTCLQDMSVSLNYCK